MKSEIRDKYKVVVGLEVHAQLATKSKIFAADYTTFAAAPNTNISTITLAHPGTLPKLNKKVLEYAIKMGLACGSKISREMIFDRKNYTYPDSPNGYQITQDKTPICIGGQVTVKVAGKERAIALNRIHLEADAGKLIHAKENSLVDLNRAGMPLIEIVTEPVLRSSEEAFQFLYEARKLVRYLEICDGNMEQGSMRCDANISVMLQDATELGSKVEIKNMNSLRNVKRAIDHEVIRQIEEVEKGNIVISETRLFDADNGTTASMRTKETMNDYRYFPDPDLSPVAISEKQLATIEASMPVLPKVIFEKLISEYKLPEYDAALLTEEKEMALYFEEVCAGTENYKAASNWLMGPVKSYLNEVNLSISELNLLPSRLAKLIALIDDGKVSFSTASQKIFPELLKDKEKSPEQVARKMNLMHEGGDDAIQPFIDEVLAQFPDKVLAYKKGKKGLIGMFMGQVMQKCGGKVDPKVTNGLLRKSLESFIIE